MWLILAIGVAAAMVRPGGPGDGTSGAATPAPAAGVPVDAVEPGGAAQRAGLRPGDLVTGWRRSEARGAVRSCEDLVTVETEEAPRGTVQLRVRRGERALVLSLPPGDWLVDAGGTEGPCATFLAVRRLARRQAWKEALAELGRAPALPSTGLFRAEVLVLQGKAHQGVSEFAEAERSLEEALRIRREIAPGSLAEAISWHALGVLHRTRGDFQKAEAAFGKARALRERLAPGSVALAHTLNNLGIVAWERGQVPLAERHLRRALSYVRRREPGGVAESQVLNNLGLCARDRGDLATADRLFSSALEIRRRLDPGHRDVAAGLSNLAALAGDRGDRATSDARYREALALFERIEPDGLDVAFAYFNLGVSAREQGDLDAAEDLLRRALGIRERLAPGSTWSAATLSSLSSLSRTRGRLEEAEAYGRRALEVRRKLAPESSHVAISLIGLGELAMDRGELVAARESLEAARGILEKVGAGTLPHAEALHDLARLAQMEGKPGEAEALFRSALATRRRLEPDGSLEAETLHALGCLLREQGRPDEAAAALHEALDALEAQMGRLSLRGEERAGFAASFSEVYRDAVALEVERGRTGEALAVLERSRARALLEMLTERDLVSAADVPAELLKEQRRMEAAVARAEAAVREVEPGGPEAGRLDVLLADVRRLRRERSAIAARVTRASPRYASVRYPRPLDLAGARRALDRGTLWLSFCVTKSRAFLFAVPAAGGPDPAVFTLPVGESALRDEVAVFRSLILRGSTDASSEAVRAQGRRLFDLVLGPARGLVAGADRLLISPDGPLATLPFAALVSGERYLVEGKPLAFVLSATLHGELRKQRVRGGRAPRSFLGFGDPQSRLPPLPATREEVRSSAALFGADGAFHVGGEASKEHVLSLASGSDILHLACHAILDRRFPMESGLALSGGLLKGWEILDRMRLRAALVTLSGCETGLGAENAGEGLLGLTWAFHYAGARSVLASLWTVSDRSTAELMGRFYRQLRRAGSKDEALRRAQVELLQGPLAHPYHWAAFELSGDGR